MTHKSHLALLAASTVAIALTLTIAISSNNNILLNNVVGDSDYTLTLDSTNAPAGMSSMAGLFQDKAFTTSNGNTIKLNYKIAKTQASYHVVLGNRGEIYNSIDTTDFNNKITGIHNITVNFTTDDAMYLQVSTRSEGGVLTTPTRITSGTSIDLPFDTNYFNLSAGDAYAYISSISIKYSCSAPNKFQANYLKGEYTGLGDDGYIYKLTLNGAAATVSSLNKESNVSITDGVVSYNGENISITFASANVTYNLSSSDDLSVLNFVSKTGAGASLFPQMDVYRVYDVENFDNYSVTGQGRDGSHEWYQTSGVRSAFYSQYYGGSSEDKMSLMGGTDYITLKTDIRHGDSGKAISIKTTTSNYMRYVQNRVYYGDPHMVGKGRYLSFWARHGYNGANVQDKNIVFDVYAFKYNNCYRLNSDSLLKNESYRLAQTVTIPATTGWHQYIIEIDENVEYKGFGLRAHSHSNTAGTIYLPIDDVQIFTYNPWATYVSPEDITADRTTGTVNVNGTIPFGVKLLPEGTAQSITYTSSNTNVATIDNNGIVTGVSAGTATITATSNVDGSLTKTCSIKVVSGTFAAGTFNGTITAAGNNVNLLVALGQRGEVAVRLYNSTDAKPTGYSYNESTKQISITTTGSYSSLKFGTITATYDSANNQLINLGCNGSIGSFISNNGNITLKAMGADANSVILHCDEDTATLNNIFKHRDKSSGQAVYTNDVIKNEYDSITGNGAVKEKFFATSSNGIMLNNNINNKTYKSIGFWVFNPTSVTRTITLYVYKNAALDSSANPASFTSVTEGWNFFCTGIGCSSFTVGTDTLYNIQLNVNGDVSLTFDEICLYV